MNRPRVVLAEDHPEMAIELRALLAPDCDVLEIAQDGAALIEAARRDLPDAIVTDIAMPGVNGLAAAAVILANQPDARIVFVTVQDSRRVIRRALDSGVRGYVLKCDAGKELVAAVHTVIEGGQYVSANARAVLAAPSDSTFQR
jgi:DNA-binding NarL/FixJ family response regulator